MQWSMGIQPSLIISIYYSMFSILSCITLPYEYSHLVSVMWPRFPLPKGGCTRGGLPLDLVQTWPCVFFVITPERPQGCQLVLFLNLDKFTFGNCKSM